MTRRTSAPFRSLAVLLLLVAGFLVAPQVVSPARACATSHADFWLSGFHGVSQAPPFYMTREDLSPAQVTIEGLIHDCGSGTPAVVSWQTANGTATAGTDYQATSDTSPNRNDNCGGDCPTGWPVEVTVLNDTAGTEPVAEHAWITISTPDGRVQGPPTRPIFIVDDDGTSRAAFAPASTLQYEGREFTTSPRIPVFRAGDASGPMTVSFSLAGSGADPAEPNDFDPDGGTINFAANQRLGYIPLTVTNDSLVENAETITATLTGAGVGSPSTATYTIIDEDSDNTPPTSRFHHPRNGLTYDYKDLRILVAHVYGNDAGSALVDADMAVRRLRMSGACQWWTGSSWVTRSCTKKLWFAMKPDPDTPNEQPYWHRFNPPLSPSMGTTVRNYRAWSRGRDGAGNVETAFQAGRNLSTFEVRRS
jgi:hypothetical protein